MASKHNKKVIKLSKTRRKRRKIEFDQKIIPIAVIIAVIIGVILAFLPNAYEVTVAGKVVGAVKNKEIVDQAKQVVETQLKDNYKAKVQFQEEPVVRRYRAKKSDYINPDYLVSYMRENMKVLVEFREIVVDGSAIGIVQGDKEVEELKQRLKEVYYGNKEVEVDFGKKVEIKPVFSEESKLIKMDRLVEKCKVTTPKNVKYTVKTGDTLWGIATQLGISLEALISENKALGEKPIINIGDVLEAKVHEPLLPLVIVKDNTKVKE